MDVTVRDIARPNNVIYKWQVQPHLGLPYVGTHIKIPRAPYQPKAQTACVVDYLWIPSPEDGGPEVHMLVTFS